MHRFSAVVLVCLLLTAGVGSVGGTVATADGTTVTQSSETGECAPTVPANFADPTGDPLGWESGYWHDEPLEIDQRDGLTRAELDAVVARTMARVETIRCLEFEKSVPVNITSREAFRREHTSGSTSERLRTFDNVKFEALFLINESTDSIEAQRANRGNSTLGFYSVVSDEIVIISDDRSGVRLSEFTLAHELVHALQDQHFDLRRHTRRTRDGVNARSGLIEGDANFVEHRYRERCQTAWNETCLLRSPGSGGGGLANVGVYLVKYHPYSDGPSFIGYVRGREGWEGVNALYERPPQTTEQVIHPERYGSDEPTNVSLEDRTSRDWRRVRPPNRPDYATMGEASLAIMFVYPLYDRKGATRIVSAAEWLNQGEDGGLDRFDPFNYDISYSAGWDGDRLHVYSNGASETAYVWRLVWDTKADATEFYEGYQQVLEAWGARRIGQDTYLIEDGGFADAFHVRVEDATVTIVNAPTVEQLPTVRQGIAVDRRGRAEPMNGATSDAGGDETVIPGQPGFGVVAGVLALLVVLITVHVRVLRVRRRR